MRSKEQNVHRYFAAIWSILGLVIGMIAVGTFVAGESVPSYVFVIPLVLSNGVAAVVGFVHGITLFVAREHDARDIKDDNGENELPEYTDQF